MLVYLWLPLLFVLGAVVGSFLNVCIARLPLEKSTFWPGSRCGSCFQPIRWYDNIPVLSYCLLRGRCRTCGTRFSVRYLLVELLTGLGFLGLFYLEVVVNVHDLPTLGLDRNWHLEWGLVPWEGWILFGYHAVLMCFLIVASGCDLQRREIPLSVTVSGAIVGLVGAMLLPWPLPYPNTAQPQFRYPGQKPPPAWWQTPETRQVVFTPETKYWAPFDPTRQPWYQAPPGEGPKIGYYAWPVWGPLPARLPSGSWQLGLATGLVGMLLGSLLMRAVRFLFSTGLGVEAMGLGDADLMMMAGAFLGWQLVVMAFFISVLPALVVGVVQLILFRDNTLPFGPSLAMGVMLTWLGWYWIGSPFQIVFFWGEVLGILAAAGSIFMLGASFFLRRVRPH
jgi:leader peptidase (prepilin peptidase)/N-methyltransferase